MKVNENIELLEYIYQNAEMGVLTLTKLLNGINETENKIKALVSNELKEFEKFYKEAEKLIKKTKIEVKENKLGKKIGASFGIKMDLLKDNSDASIAHMITEGITMGIVDISSKIDRFKDKADKKIIKLAKEYLKYQQSEIEVLKEYL